VAAALNNVAEIHRLQRQYSTAEPLYHQALEILIDTLGTSHPSTAAAMSGEADSGRSGGDSAAPRFACPIVHCLTDGRNNFVAVRPCGCVVSARAMKQIAGSSGDDDRNSSESTDDVVPVSPLGHNASFIHASFIHASCSRAS
jgi:hypothetical protein